MPTVQRIDDASWQRQSLHGGFAIYVVQSVIGRRGGLDTFRQTCSITMRLRKLSGNPRRAAKTLSQTKRYSSTFRKRWNIGGLVIWPMFVSVSVTQCAKASTLRNLVSSLCLVKPPKACTKFLYATCREVCVPVRPTFRSLCSKMR